MSTTQTTPEQEAAAEVSNPYASMFGTRNDVRVPLTRRVVVKGQAKNTPYITLDFSKLSDSDFIKAYGIDKLKELVESKMNVGGRAMCSEIIGEEREKAGYTSDNFTAEELALFQDWADGKVEERVPLGELKKALSDLVLKGDLDNPDTLMQIVDLRKEINARSRK